MEMTEQFEKTARELEDRIRPQIEEAKKKVSDLNERAVGYIKENPGKCLLGAVAAGYIIGRIASR
ncbi:MAG TPA: hypothetical protein VFH68_05950 [Polyangia bacterium]|jgi:ElaB/YqjD/DUF883 family membrane-anchored ribosome-binding protein|nr:hypothetical protein [Polyangia bacterium]